MTISSDIPRSSLNGTINQINSNIIIANTSTNNLNLHPHHIPIYQATASPVANSLNTSIQTINHHLNHHHNRSNAAAAAAALHGQQNLELIQTTQHHPHHPHHHTQHLLHHQIIAPNSNLINFAINHTKLNEQIDYSAKINDHNSVLTINTATNRLEGICEPNATPNSSQVVRSGGGDASEREGNVLNLQDASDQQDQKVFVFNGGQNPTALSVSLSPTNAAASIPSHHHHSHHQGHLPHLPLLCPNSPSSNSTIDGHSVKEQKIFTSKADLQLHTQIHMREAKPYKCSQCAKAFANSSYLSQHTRIHLGIKPYRCEICQRKFTQLSHLQQHIRTHTGDKPYKCRHPGCQKAFSQLSNLQSHSRCHQTDKPYKCNSCYKCFADEPSLLEHIPKHKESKHLKTHICQYCGKSYTQETYLTKHMQKHAERTDKRPPISAINTSTTSRTTTSINTQLPTVTSAVDHPYWPKVSPDSATSISEVLQQQHQQHQHQQQQLHQSHHDFNLNNPHQLNDLQGHHRSLIVESNQGNSARDDVGEDLVVSNSRQQNNPSSNLNGIIVASSASNNPYDVSTTISKAAALSNSAFTPIQSMPHLNSIGHHHQLGQRPYLYDAISFSQNKNMNQSPGNSFPNQLISLHQIRNYAHQPGALMTGEHLLGVSVGVGKDKG